MKRKTGWKDRESVSVWIKCGSAACCGFFMAPNCGHLSTKGVQNMEEEPKDLSTRFSEKVGHAGSAGACCL